MHSLLPFRAVARTLVLLTAVVVSACSMDKAKAPALAGPSEFGLSITLSASPDVVERDGASQAALSVFARDAAGQAVPGQRFAVWVTPANGGTLSASEVVTGGDGRGMVVYTAAPASVAVLRVTINARPVGENFDNSRVQTISIGLRGYEAPRLDAFRFSPSSPRQFDLVTFDASDTTVEGVVCGTSCVFHWTFGNEAVAVGDVVTYRFQTPGVHMVTLVITGPGGISVTKSQPVTVGEGVPPQGDFSFSPTEPLPGDTVFFNASASVARNGARIVEYIWDFGNGQTSSSSSPTASVAYGTDERTYSVTLTVRDSNGLTHTVSKAVSVKTPSADDDDDTP